MVHHSFSLYIGFHYKSNCSHLKEMETERFYCFIRVYFFDRLNNALSNKRSRHFLFFYHQSHRHRPFGFGEILRLAVGDLQTSAVFQQNLRTAATIQIHGIFKP